VSSSRRPIQSSRNADSERTVETNGAHEAQQVSGKRCPGAAPSARFGDPSSTSKRIPMRGVFGEEEVRRGPGVTAGSPRNRR
jgi:hypothetical protein